jgi:CCR4-NOT transcription complex subunit 6
MQRPDFRKSDDFFNRVVPKDNIAVLALLEQKDNGAKVIVVNVHLHWDPAYSDVKLIQAALLLEELESNLIKWNRQFQFTEKPTTDIKKISSIVPILICGDLNSLPDSGVFSLLSSGHLAADHADLKAFDYRPLTDGGLTNKLELQSAYQNISDMEFTNFTPTFKGIIDYIWYTKATMTPTGLLSHVDKEYVQKSVGFPNPHNPSDHIPLLVSFRKQNLTNDNRQVFFK